MTSRLRFLLVTCLWVAGCGGDPPPAAVDVGAPDASSDASSDAWSRPDAWRAPCEVPLTIQTGDANGHPQPLGAGPTEARAGRIAASELPDFDSGLQIWGSGEFLLANDRIAVAIEDVGPSDLYDPWGGRITGLARVEDHHLVEPGDFGEFFVLTGRSTIVTRSVTVINDGSNGEPAVIRAEGPVAPLPFFDAIVHDIFTDALDDMTGAIDYTLAPGSDHVDIAMTFASRRNVDVRIPLVLHGFLYADRMPPFVDAAGFDQAGVATTDWMGFADERHTSYVYELPEGHFSTNIAASGFNGRLAPARVIPGCAVTTFPHARITLGAGPDGALAARARERGDAVRAITGIVREPDGAPAENVRVTALRSGTGAWITRSNLTGPDGAYTLHVPMDADVMLEPVRTSNGRAPQVAVAASVTTQDLTMPPSGFLHVSATDELGDPIPARISVFAASGTSFAEPPSMYGEEDVPDGRVAVAYAIDGQATVRVPVGTFRVVASRGYEWELGEDVLTVTAHGETASATLALEHSVDTTGVMCGDFHIHTRRSADSGDDATLKLRSAIADGLEIPVRSDHEYVADFQSIIEALGMQHYAHGIGSIEMTSMELWGHMGVFPLVEDPLSINMGAPAWQEYPTPEHPEIALRTMGPHEVFEQVRVRPEHPAIIINHPRGSTNYFGYVGYDPITGTARRTADWDLDFDLVEVFNDSAWRANRDGTVGDWLSLLDHGRRVFAVGSSDSHGITGSPVGYPRTCVSLGSDDPIDVDPIVVRDELSAGHATISGGIYVTTRVGEAASGETAAGVGTRTSVHVHVEAASWVDVDAIDVVVDGTTVQTIDILPTDRDPAHPATRFDHDVDVDVAATGSYVVVAVYGDATLEPVHRGRIPFGVANPIFLMR